MLKEIAKILVGVLITEMFCFIWLIAENMLPVKFIGFEIGFSASMAIILTDFTLMILMAYYAWIRKPNRKEEKIEE